MQRVRLLLAVVVLVSGWSSVGRLNPVAAQTAAPAVDLAALAIYPGDTRDDGYVLVDGRGCLTPRACADPHFFGGATEASLTELGLTRAYWLGIAKYPPDGSFPPERTIATLIAEFDTRSAASEGLSAALAWLADPSLEGEVSRAIGDEAELYRFTGEFTDDPSATGTIGLRFRSGSLVVGIEVREYADRDPDQANIERLARLVAQRIGEEPDQAGLDTLAVHHRANPSEYYVHLDGETIRTVQQTEEGYQTDAAEFDDAGIEDVFLSRQTLASGDGSATGDVLLVVTIYRLSNTIAASNYLNSASTDFARYLERIGALNIEPEEPPLVGNESVWYLNVFSDAYQAMAYVRVGTVVTRIIWQRNLVTPENPTDARLQQAEEELLPGAQYTAEQQVLCLDNGGCPGVTRLSSRLLP
jgi:hypothetical protein